MVSGSPLPEWAAAVNVFCWTDLSDLDVQRTKGGRLKGKEHVFSNLYNTLGGVYYNDFNI